MYSRTGPIVAGMRTGLGVFTESLSKKAAFQFRSARSSRAQIVPVISCIIAIKADVSALKRALQQQTGPKSCFSFRSSETNFNYLIRRMNSYVAARQIQLSRSIKFANVPPDTHGCSPRVAVQGLGQEHLSPSTPA